MVVSYEKEFELTRNRTIKTANELYYGPYVVRLLKKATTERELTQIMANARLDKYKGMK